MNLFFSPILHLEITEDIPSMGIFNGANIFDQIPRNIWEMLGTSIALKVYQNPVWFQYHDIGNNNADSFTHLISGSNNYTISTSLWIIKDNAVFSPHSYLYRGEDRPCVDNRNTFVSNSKGKYESTPFTSEDINIAKTKFEKLCKIMEVKTQSVATEKPTTVATGGFNMLEHNLFNRVHRSANFLNFARINSHILTKISWYIVAMEALFLTSNDGDISFKLRTRIAIYIGGTNDEKDEIYETIKSGYSMRSSFLHGDKIPKKLTSLDRQIEISSRLDSILRTIFNRIIDNKGDQDFFLNDKNIEDYFLNSILGKS